MRSEDRFGDMNHAMAVSKIGPVFDEEFGLEEMRDVVDFYGERGILEDDRWCHCLRNPPFSTSGWERVPRGLS